MSVARPTRIKIAGVDRTDYLAMNSLRIQKHFNQRSTADFDMTVLQTGYSPPIGAQIEVATYDGAEAVVERSHFAGIIYSRELKCIGRTFNVTVSLRCVDLTAILDRRVCLESFLGSVNEPVDVGSIVVDLINRFAEGEGITTNNVEFGSYSVTTDLPFKNRTLTECLKRLSTLSGMRFFIGDDRDLHFESFTSVAAPISITESSDNWRNPVVRQSLERYRNVQRVQTDQMFEATVTATWRLRDPAQNVYWYPNTVKLDSAPIVTVNDLPKTIGAIVTPPVGGFPGTHDFYYIPGTFGVYVDDVNDWAEGQVVVITAGTVLANSVVRSNEDEIAVRKALEGGSGKHESVDDQRDLDSYQALVDYADGLLRRHGRIAKEISFETDESGLAPGQRIPILYPSLGIGFITSAEGVGPGSGADFGQDEFGNPVFAGALFGSGVVLSPEEFLIESVTYELQIGNPDFIRTSIKCSDAELIGTNLDFMERLVDMARIGNAPIIEEGIAGIAY